MSIPFKYLGMDVGPRKKPFWQLVVNKIKSILTKWKGRHLSFARRVCLIKSVLTVLPLYYMSLFKMPSSVCEEIRKIQRKFLWGWGVEGRKIAWVQWEKLYQNKKEGGLGIQDIKVFNIALLGKWKWRLVTKKIGLQKDILESKYRSQKSLNSTQSPNNESWGWKDLRKS